VASSQDAGLTEESIMPIIHVSITGKPDPALSARIAEQVTELTKKYLGKDPTVTAVAVSYIDPQHWFAGGKSLASQHANSFWLDIKIVDGTNIKQDMANYLEHVYAGLSRTLGNVHHESYILVHEVSGAAYGFGGKTQEYRHVMRAARSAELGQPGPQRAHP
jgi:4-oxalocrotonate tautomerase